MRKMEFPELGPTFEEETGGVRVTQNHISYPVEGWQLWHDVRSMIYLSISKGFNCLWVKNHPSDKKLRNGTSTHYICFARDHEMHWDYLLAIENKFGESITVNKKHRDKLRAAKVRFVPQTSGSKHLMVPPHLRNMERVIDALK